MADKKRAADNQVGSKAVIIVTLAVVVAAFLGEAATRNGGRIARTT